MTKVEAIARVMEDNGGAASLSVIYENIEKYYPNIKVSKEWEAGVRGVLYRELYKERMFKRIGLSIYALTHYKQETKPLHDRVRMHSYMEGICIELGNFNGYRTFTADPSAQYRDNLLLKDFTTIGEFPQFTYDNIIRQAKRIDVIWFNKRGAAFPRKVFEVVDSISTLNGAFNRSLQLQNFITDFVIVAPEKHKEKYEETLELEIYHSQKERFSFINYDDILELYDATSRKNCIESKLFR